VMRSNLVLVPLFLNICAAYAQPAAQFEVVSVKPSPPNRREGGGIHLDGARFSSAGIPVRNLIYSAYGVPTWRLAGGPGWLGSDGYDIIGTLPHNFDALPPNTKDEQLSLMMRALLADRFKLAIHREMRDCSIYELEVAKGGPKLVASAGGKFTYTAPVKRRGHLEMPGTSIVMFVHYLTSMPAVGRPVLDKTDLKGPYNITLDWTPDNIGAGGTDGGPSIFTAVQEQLGLKLKPSKSSFEFVVIDHVDRPSEN
jgi:uncharacterized protein (TIGR03435 family)